MAKAIIIQERAVILPPPDVLQACCFGDLTCADLSPQDCILQGGAGQGIGTDCATTTCVFDGCDPVCQACAPPMQRTMNISGIEFTSPNVAGTTFCDTSFEIDTSPAAPFCNAGAPSSQIPPDTCGPDGPGLPFVFSGFNYCADTPFHGWFAQVSIRVGFNLHSIIYVSQNEPCGVGMYAYFEDSFNFSGVVLINPGEMTITS